PRRKAGAHLDGGPQGEPRPRRGDHQGSAQLLGGALTGVSWTGRRTAMATQTSREPQAIRGVDELVERLDRAVQEPTPERITAAVKETLEEMVAGGTFELPAALTEPKSDHYARRRIHRSAEHGYTVIAMTWGTGQGTALHDHSGMWCV